MKPQQPLIKEGANLSEAVVSINKI